MRFEITDNPNTEDITYIHNKLKEFNNKHFEVNDVTPVCSFVYDDENVKIGGIIAETHGNWIDVDYLWVHDNYRNKDIGSRLLRNVENEAIKRGCRYSVLNTFEFQAKDFYMKFGYKVVFTLEQYPVNGKRYYLIKELW